MDHLLKAARTSGSLNLSNHSLSKVPDAIYQNLDTLGENERWWEAVDLQKLILAHNSIEILEEDLINLSSLSVLNISHNKLVSLPAAIGKLHVLKSLDISFNLLENIPDEIGLDRSLVKLDCSSNQLKELPCSFGGCSELLELKVSSNMISNFPASLVNCYKLTKLDFEGNKLSVLPENMIASWVMLKELNCSKNFLTSIPENIGSLLHLICLDLRHNRITIIPPSIIGCSALAEVYLGNNALSSLPSEMGDLPKLSILDLHSNQLKEFSLEACKMHLSMLDLSNNSLSSLPPELGMMTTLRKLLVTGNPLRTLRSSLASGPTPALLKYLRSRLSNGEDSSVTRMSQEDIVSRAFHIVSASKELSLKGLGLTSIPLNIQGLKEVFVVDLSENSIEDVTSEISLCVSLQVLILSKNRIKDWPVAALERLSGLTCLKLDYNPLRQIPSDGFRAVPNLRILDLSGNATCLPEHAPFSNLLRLQELYLRHMNLHEVPSNILKLQNLTILDLSQNFLSCIPEGFQSLTSLNELDLSNNNITRLPPELGLLETSLHALRLDGNPMKSIRRAILDQGTKAILKYLKGKMPEP